MNKHLTRLFTELQSGHNNLDASKKALSGLQKN